MTARVTIIVGTILALLTNGLVPAGFMPKVSEDSGFLEMVICTGTGQKTIYLPLDDANSENNDDMPSDEVDHTVCAFANTVLIQLGEPTVVGLLELPVQENQWVLDHQTHRARLHALPPPSRGPPALAPNQKHIAVASVLDTNTG
ncbi:MAG: hypothetical protein KI792_11705 [Alphaproteobacteria bacterium]|nr:hypothetical protein [Alphaproteobacteria bacterium SS10]